MEGYVSLRDYLERSGVLATGDAAAIALAKREYRKAYMRQYKRKRRSMIYEVVLSIDVKKYKQLEGLATSHGYSIPQFLLHLADAYIEDFPVVQHPDRFNGLHLLLRQIHSEVVFMADNSKLGDMSMQSKELKESILRLGKEMEELSRIKDLEKYIRRSMGTDKERVFGILRKILSEENKES